MTADQWLIAVALGAVLAGTHLLALRVAGLPARTQDYLASAGGGAGVAFIFVHILPSLASGGREFSSLDIARYAPSAIVEAILFLTAMTGLVVFYSLDVRADEGRGSTKTNFIVHLASFALISGVYAYTMPSLVTAGWDFAVLFTVVLGAHTLLADRRLASAHPDLFRHETRWIGTGAVVAGLLCAYFLPPANDLVLAVATAFLAGGLLMTTFRDELPAASNARLPWFLLGIGLMSGLLIVATIIHSA